MTSISQNPREFQHSITKELSIVKNRVRNLIGSANWGEEGRYKEAILRNVIRRFLPHNLSVATGFVARAGVVSKQLDIIVYDNSYYPLLFSEGDFIVTSPDNVKGIIEVKTNLNATGLKKAIEHFERDFLNELLPIDTAFYGIFSYDFSMSKRGLQRVVDILRNSQGIINHFALGENYFIKRWNKESAPDLQIEEVESDFYNVYDLKNLAFSYFIANLIAQSSIGVSERHWFLFPIPGTKETKRTEIAEIQDLQ